MLRHTKERHNATAPVQRLWVPRLAAARDAAAAGCAPWTAMAVRDGLATCPAGSVV
jgi:hypothetical protein